MHVGFALLTLFPGRVGGSETNVRGLLGEFASGNGPERVTVLANRHVAAAYESAGPVKVHHVRSYRPGDRMVTRALAMSAGLALPRLTARDLPGGLDVMHYPVTVPIPRSDLPAAVTLLDVQHHDLPGFFSRAEAAFRRHVYDRAARNADVVITISEFSRERIIETLDIPPGRVVAVHLGVDRERFTPEGPPSDLDLPERYLFYPANLWPHKNHERLIQALALTPAAELVLSGQTYGGLAGLMDRARALGVAERVRHIGHVPHAAVAALYRSSTALIFPSLYEGFGLPPLEAMASGCPVAASDAGSLPEIVGDAGLLFDPLDAEAMASAMRTVWESEAERGRLTRAGRERALRFSWRVAAERHREIYAGALS